MFIFWLSPIIPSPFLFSPRWDPILLEGIKLGSVDLLGSTKGMQRFHKYSTIHFLKHVLSLVKIVIKKQLAHVIF